jgi:hypothetical protein
MSENPCAEIVARHQPEIDLLTQVAECVREALAEYRADCAVAGRLEITKAQRLLDRAFHGERV